MEKIKAFFSWLKGQALWLRIVLMVLLSAAVVILTCASCGTTRAVVHNGAHGTSTEIKITTANPTTVTASPNVQFGVPVQNGWYLFSILLIFSQGVCEKKKFKVFAESDESAKNKLDKFLCWELGSIVAFLGYEISKVSQLKDK